MNYLISFINKDGKSEDTYLKQTNQKEQKLLFKNKYKNKFKDIIGILNLKNVISENI